MRKQGHVEKRPLPDPCLRRRCNGSKRSLSSCRFVHCDLAPLRERFEQEIEAKEMDG